MRRWVVVLDSAWARSTDVLNTDVLQPMPGAWACSCSGVAKAVTKGAVVVNLLVLLQLAVVLVRPTISAACLA